uniref:DJ-1_PfpI domain-containing protein n=1 Tax=Panagrellus redivivus TaxID=6233 RepID=A0A7E4ZPY1_PANRE
MSTFSTIVLICIARHQAYGTDVAKVVDGGVEFVNTGSVELIVPEILSFTVKRLQKSQLCVGVFMICYEASSIIMRNEQ